MAGAKDHPTSLATNHRGQLDMGRTILIRAHVRRIFTSKVVGGIMLNQNLVNVCYVCSFVGQDSPG